ncbi:hypothetical protein OWV82_000815 [Melia azedarach]|uniref:Uncharacterized protein n=1 Tax=Melia azedarach TaxID=155640 RepID=A0ACC1YYT3_MELAZ|nr:hypothetical protein OWV82_000815 [Melia azedarach]
MLHKQTISIALAPNNRKPSRRPKQELECSNFRFVEKSHIPQNQRSIILVPPLRYPPKTVAGKLFQPEKENRFHELEGINHSLQRLNPRCHNYPHFDQQTLDGKSTSTVFRNGGTRSELSWSSQGKYKTMTEIWRNQRLVPGINFMDKTWRVCLLKVKEEYLLKFTIRPAYQLVR